MTTSTIILETRNGNKKISCDISFTLSGSLRNISFSYAGYNFKLEKRDGKIVGKSITTQPNGTHLFTWVNVSKDSECLAYREEKTIHPKSDYGTIEHWANGMNGE